MTKSTKRERLAIYTDGGCNPNPGKGGWGAVLLYPDRKRPVELSGVELESTNNRMELTAAIEALRAVTEPTALDLYTDSRYLMDGITKWVSAWRARDWRMKKGDPVKNSELWRALDAEVQRHQVEWHWVKGHAGDRWNTRADELAGAAAEKVVLPLDDQTAVHLFTAAAYSGKTGRGAWAFELHYRDAGKGRHGHDDETSANRMHLLAVIEGLAALKRRVLVFVYTTSDYVKGGASSWLPGWRARQWRTREGKDVAHRDLWERLSGLQDQHEVRWFVVPRTELPPPMAIAKEAASCACKLPPAADPTVTHP